MRRVVEPLQGTPSSCDRIPGRRSKTSFPWAGMLRPFWAKRHFDATLSEPSMSKNAFVSPILRKSLQSRSRFSKKILERVSRGPPETTRELVGLEDSTAPYDAGFGHLQRTPSIMIQAGSIVAQVRRMSRGHSCASSEMSKKRLIPAMLRKISRVAQRFQNKTFGRDCSARSGGPTTDGVEVDRTLANSRELCCDGKTENDIGNPMKHGD